MSKSQSGIVVKKGTNEGSFELEQQFILRMPPDVSGTLRDEVVNGSPSLSHNISIEKLADGHTALIRYGQFIYNAKLVDLPCIIESLKTVDKKTFYKTADICQMLVCTEEDIENVDMLKKKDRDKKFTCNHGITPPLKNVRKRRFRKTLTKKYNELPDIEKEVRQLFRMDAEAIDVKWELITEENQPSQSPSRDDARDEGSGLISMDNKLTPNTSRTNLAGIDLFGELSSSEDDEKDVNVMDSPDEDSVTPSVVSSQFPPDADSMDQSEPGCIDTDKLERLKSELESVRSQRMEHEDRMATIDNPALQNHLQILMDRLVQQEYDKEQEYQNHLAGVD